MSKKTIIKVLLLVAFGAYCLSSFHNYTRMMAKSDEIRKSIPFKQRLDIAFAENQAQQQREQKQHEQGLDWASIQGRQDAREANIADYQKVMERELRHGKTLLRIRLYGNEDMSFREYAYKPNNPWVRDLYWRSYINELQKLMPEVVFDPKPSATYVGNPVAEARLRQR